MKCINLATPFNCIKKTASIPFHYVYCRPHFCSNTFQQQCSKTAKWSHSRWWYILINVFITCNLDQHFLKITPEKTKMTDKILTITALCNLLITAYTEPLQDPHVKHHSNFKLYSKMSQNFKITQNKQEKQANNVTLSFYQHLLQNLTVHKSSM